MSDRIPGTSYDNPIWYRGYRIHLGPAYTRDSQWTYSHEEYDGPEDRRIGLCATEQECRDEIDDALAPIEAFGRDGETRLDPEGTKAGSAPTPSSQDTDR